MVSEQVQANFEISKFRSHGQKLDLSIEFRSVDV